MISLQILLFLFVLFWSVYGDWSQQYRDPASSNNVELDPSTDFMIKSGWNYTNPEEYSIFYGSPAVSEKGVVYLPFLEYPQYWLQLRAILPNGTMWWLANYVGSDEDCSVVFMTNVVYCKEHGLVIVGWTCTTGGAYYAKHGQIVAYNAETGQEEWRSPLLYDANDMGSISIGNGLVFASGGYSCGRDGTNEKSNIRQIVVIDILTGRPVDSISFNHVGCSSQTKVFSSNGIANVIIPADLPYGFKCNGDLVYLECMPGGNCSQHHLQNIDISWDAKFAFASNELVYGSYGLNGNPNQIFALNIETGKLAFANKGYCQNGNSPSGPTVDDQGRAYYSCGNLVFAVDSKGSLLWKSDVFSSTGYDPLDLMKLSPSLLIAKGILMAVDQSSTTLVTLSTTNGTIIRKYNIPRLSATDNGCWEPPIIVGNSVYLIKSHDLSKYYLFSLSLKEVAGV